MMRKVKLTDELGNHIGDVLSGVLPKFPKSDSQGMYDVEIHKALTKVKQGNAIRLFFCMVVGSDDMGLVIRTREQLSTAIGVRYNKGSFHKMIENLIDADMICRMSNTFWIKPSMVLPRNSNPKVKSALQEVWSTVIEFN